MDDKLTLTAFNLLDTSQAFFLPLDERRPILLGTGRNAVVFLGRTAPDEEHTGNEYIAVKFLKDDVNQQYAEMIRLRFRKEASQTQEFGQYGEFFVRYRGVGTIGDVRPNEFSYIDQLDNDEGKKALRNETESLKVLKREYGLQGIFYITELCQGTLYDIFESDKPWVDAVKIYQSLDEMYGKALRQQADKLDNDIQEVKNRYMMPERISANHLSGYGILNAFRADHKANRVRNNAVLRLFRDVVKTVFQTHLYGDGLTHRDLKLGNLFIQHLVDPEGFANIVVKLADLGYLADFHQLEKGDFSLRVEGWRNSGALVLGSQFYRAPEQAQLPIEVRVTVDPVEKDKVWIRESKIDKIEKGDWLALGDHFVDQEHMSNSEHTKNISSDGNLQINAPERQVGNVYRINEIDKPNGSFKLTLDDKLVLSQEEDLQAHIIKSTGFHTDGFSLGAILYDLISGGKNPESFYIYCLAKFQEIKDYTVKDIVNILTPPVSSHPTEATSLDLSSHSLNRREKFRAFRAVNRADNVDALIDSILILALASEGVPTEEVADNYRYRKFPLIEDLLRDKRNVPIPRDILEIIIKCMLRDVDGAYYSTKSAEGYLSEENRQATKKLYEDVGDLLDKPANSLPDNFPDFLEEDLLLKLRMFWTPPPGITSMKKAAMSEKSVITENEDVSEISAGVAKNLSPDIKINENVSPDHKVETLEQ